MSIRPIDLQVIVPKANNNPLTREHVVNKEALQLQQAQMETKKVSTLKEKRVNELAHKNDSKIEEKKEPSKDAQKKKQAASQKNDKEAAKDAEKDKKPTVKDWNFHRFDMKV